MIDCSRYGTNLSSEHRTGNWLRLLCIAALTLLSVSSVPAQTQQPGQALNSPAPAAKLSHPAIVLKDDSGRNVLETGKPVSTRQTCGGDCHDYDFITNSFHFQQGKAEMDRSLLTSHGVAPYNSSPGMFGKFSLIPNRQLTHHRYN